MSVDAILQTIAGAGLLVCDLGQRRTMTEEETQEKVGWSAKLRSRGPINSARVQWFEPFYALTAEEALKGALAKAGDRTPRSNGFPTMLHKAVVRVAEEEPDLEDML